MILYNHTTNTTLCNSNISIYIQHILSNIYDVVYTTTTYIHSTILNGEVTDRYIKVRSQYSNVGV